MNSEKEKTNKVDAVQVPAKNGRKSEKVWRVIAITTIVVLVGLLVFGLVKWNSYNKQIEDLQSQVSGQQEQANDTQTSVSDNSGSVATAVLVKIPEAGIQFAVPSGYPTITYKSNGDGSFAIVASEPINPGNTCQAQDGSVGTLVGNTRERLISLGDDPDTGEFGILTNGKYWTVATGGVCDNNNSSNKVNQLLDYIKSNISAL